MSAARPETAPSRSRATRLTILSRGATRSNRDVRLSSDEPLLSSERERARRLAESLPRFDSVLHAPEISAAETAAFFSPTATACESLADVDYGTWRGKTIEEIVAGSPEDFERWRTDPSAAPHGGESFDAVRARAARWLEGLHAAGGRRLAVTHAVVVKILLADILGAPTGALWRIDVEPLGILSLSSDGRRWALRAFGAGLPRLSEV